MACCLIHRVGNWHITKKSVKSEKELTRMNATYFYSLKTTLVRDNYFFYSSIVQRLNANKGQKIRPLREQQLNKKNLVTIPKVWK